jgi:hypothetical protein
VPESTDAKCRSILTDAQLHVASAATTGASLVTFGETAPCRAKKPRDCPPRLGLLLDTSNYSIGSPLPLTNYSRPTSMSKTRG